MSTSLFRHFIHTLPTSLWACRTESEHANECHLPDLCKHCLHASVQIQPPSSHSNWIYLLRLKHLKWHVYVYLNNGGVSGLVQCACVSGLPQSSLCVASHNIALITESSVVRLHALRTLFHRFLYPGIIISKPFNQWPVKGLFYTWKSSFQKPRSFFSNVRTVKGLYI